MVASLHGRSNVQKERTAPANCPLEWPPSRVSICAASRRLQACYRAPMLPDEPTRNKTLPKTVFDATYELHEELGRGASGIVYRAIERETGNEFAVKTLHKRALALAGISEERWNEEVEILRKINHPHIVSLKGVYESEEKVVLVLELVRGRELFDVILRQGRIPETEAQSIFLQLADAIAYLHAIGILHRDVKPQNVQIATHTTAPLDDGKDRCGAGAPRKRPRDSESEADSQPVPQAKLLDFGLAKRLLRSATTSALGGGVSIVGTPMYIAPEVERLAAGGRDKYDTQADMFSLGVTLYVALWCVLLSHDRFHHDGELTLGDFACYVAIAPLNHL